MKFPIGLSLELWTVLTSPLCVNTQGIANQESSPESCSPAIHQGPQASSISHIVRLPGEVQGLQVNKHTYWAGHSKDLEVHSQEPGVKAISHLG